jgi:hypothetical protein
VDNGTSEINQRVPEILFCVYHGMIAGITPALVIGAIAERGRFLPTVVFMVLWSTFVYDFLAYWSWGKNGWLNTLGALDFAGGTPGKHLNALIKNENLNNNLILFYSAHCIRFCSGCLCINFGRKGGPSRGGI